MDGIITVWLPLEVRRRGRSLLVLALLVAFGTATVLTAVAGARRGDGAVDRLLAVTTPATAVVVPNRAGFDWAGLRALPQVEAVTTFPGYSSAPLAEDPGDDPPSPFVAADAEAMSAIERPVVLAGRLPDPSSAHEAVVTPAFAVRGFGVGRQVTVLLPRPQDAAGAIAGARTGPPAGPRVPVTIVGVIRSTWYVDEPAGRGHLILSPGLVAAYPDEILGPERQAPLNGLVRVADGGLPALRAWLAGQGDVEVIERAETLAHVRRVIGFESGSLLVFAVAAFLTAVVLVGQAVFRYATTSAADLRVLASVGMTRRQAATTTATVVCPAAFLGAGAGTAMAIIASRWLPYGTAALYEPSPGADADWPVLGLGWLAATALVTAGAAVVTLLPAPAAARRSGLTRLALPVPVTTGLRFALEPGNGVALLGAVTGVLGVVAAAVFAAGVADAVARPERFGRHYALMVVFGHGGRDFTPARPALTSIAAVPGVAGALDLRVASGRSGQVSVVAHTYDPVGAPVPLILTEGGPPRLDGDIVLGVTTARDLGVHLGDRIPLTGDAATRTMRVTGLGFAVESSTSDYDTGAWITPGAYDAIFTGFKEHGGLVFLDPGQDPLKMAALITGRSGGRLLVLPPFEPPQRAEIRDVAVLPVALGVFLTVLALGATAHALFTAVRRRARDLAVLRALGMTPGQTRVVVVVQGVVTVTIGLVVGLPLGLALGRALWRIAAGIMPLQYVPPSAALIWLAPVALLAALGLALLPGRRAARLPLGAALRAE
ncbi:ABC transporter permease [Herbidospora mongoliensis]|uniref:ABC transporter permease n=1 Tax=Herbidospora mongoliensis TaxID=688067 RepID=UPI00082E829A|nr:FtsX-like permease family protein [Herbidospora mongoliensis]